MPLVPIPGLFPTCGLCWLFSICLPPIHSLFTGSVLRCSLLWNASPRLHYQLTFNWGWPMGGSGRRQRIVVNTVWALLCPRHTSGSPKNHSSYHTVSSQLLLPLGSGDSILLLQPFSSKAVNTFCGWSSLGTSASAVTLPVKSLYLNSFLEGSLPVHGGTIFFLHSEVLWRAVPCRPLF